MDFMFLIDAKKYDILYLYAYSIERIVYYMNQKEIGEIRRRFNPSKSNIGRIYGCFVNNNKEIVSYIDSALSLLPETESEKFLSLLKKVLSGTQGKNLIDICFSNEQVTDSEEHKLLMAMRDTALKDSELMNRFYQKIIERIDTESGYLILTAFDKYDVIHKGVDGENDADASDEVFSYIICSICPVKKTSPELSYCVDENAFHSRDEALIVSAPELGFMFPAFDDRAANIYNALYYSRSADDIHQDFIDAVFHTEPPMSASEQRDLFTDAFTDALSEDMSFDIVQTVHEQVYELLEQHKDSREAEPPEITSKEIGRMLEKNGVSEKTVSDFTAKCDEHFGTGAVLNPNNIIDSRRFEVVTPDVKITVNPEKSYLVETRIIDGHKYVMINADNGIEVNGINIDVK